MYDGYTQFENAVDGNPLSDENEDDDEKDATDLDYRSFWEQQLKEQMETEFDDKLAKEKDRLLEKHGAEIHDLKQQINEITAKMKRYQQDIIRKNMQIQQLQQVNEMKDGMKRGQRTMDNPNNETQDSTKCKVFGWNVW